MDQTTIDKLQSLQDEFHSEFAGMSVQGYAKAEVAEMTRTQMQFHAATLRVLTLFNARGKAVDDYDFLNRELKMRDCGDCSLCCVNPAIAREVLLEDRDFGEKPACTACRYLNFDGMKGSCAIYERRPSVCKGYVCIWALGYVNEEPAPHGVAWTLQPDFTDVPKQLLVGFGMDVMAEMKNRVNRRIVRDALAMPYVSSAMIRDAWVAVHFSKDGAVRMASVVREDRQRTLLDPASDRLCPIRHPMYDVERCSSNALRKAPLLERVERITDFAI